MELKYLPTGEWQRGVVQLRRMEFCPEWSQVRAPVLCLVLGAPVLRRCGAVPHACRTHRYMRIARSRLYCPMPLRRV